MKKKIKIILESTLTIILALAIIFFIAQAGNLTPSSAPADTMKTLDDIYYKLQSSGSAGSFGLNPSSAPTSTMRTLQEIYDAAPDFNSSPGNATAGDVCNSKTFYTNSATRQTGTRTACSDLSFPDTGQTSSYGTGDDADYTSSNSAHTCDMSFTDNGNGTITDNCTGLMWKKCVEPDTSTSNCAGTQSTYTWTNALARCEGLSYAGYTDWRLPNVKELVSIVNYQVYDPSINTTYFPATPSSYHWSSTTLMIRTDYAWYVNFYYGNAGSSNLTSAYYVRCVRG